MKKQVVLITNYFHFKSEKESNRYYFLADKLSGEKDIELEVITSLFYHRKKTFRNNVDGLKNEVNYKVSFIYEPGYKKNVCFKRLLSSRIFAKNVIKYLKTLSKIDVIYQVVPSLDVAHRVVKFAKRKGIPCIIDIQDLLPEAFQMVFDVPLISKILFFPFKVKANFIYKNADDVCAVSNTYIERALSVNKKNITGHPVFIGIDLQKFDSFYKTKRQHQHIFTIGYCGSLDVSYDLETVIKAMSLIEQPIKLLIIGDGEKKEKLIELSQNLKVDCDFTGFVPYGEMCSLLSRCDAVVNPISGKSLATIINKHGDYAASGLPVLNTQNSPEYIKLINKYRMGLSSQPSDINELKNNILFLLEHEIERKKMGENARRCAEELFDRNKTYNELVEAVLHFL